MIKKMDSKKARAKRHARVRSKISGTPERPRLCVYRSTKHIYAQLIDDVNGVTLASASSMDKALQTLYSTEAATCITAESRNWLTVPVRTD